MKQVGNSVESSLDRYASFTRPVQAWYFLMMARSYVGIISHRGLESFLPEYEHVARFLVRRAYRRRPIQALCYWAVIDDGPAYGIRQHLLDGESSDALGLLYAAALELGSILPAVIDDDQLPVHAECDAYF